MKPSKYNILVEEADTSRTILYNTLYGSLTVLQPHEAELAREALQGYVSQDTDGASVRDAMVKQKFLITDAEDELEIVRNRKTAGVRDANRLDVIIMPTLDCNFACSYCYEKHPVAKMTDDTEKVITAWLAKEIPKYKVLLLSWFGGEPLLAHQRLVSILRSASEIARKANVECIHHITTNGYLLSPQLIHNLVECGLKSYQITMDGAPAMHNRQRMLKSGEGTFDQIFKNIIALSRAHVDVRVSLRINFNHHNIDSIPELLRLFPNDIRHQLRVVYEPIFGACTLSATHNLPAKDISRALALYYRMAKDLGYDVIIWESHLRTGKLVYCYAEREHQVIINYNADVFKCSVGSFDRKSRVGYIDSNGDLVKESSWGEWCNGDSFDGQCLDCQYLPLCMGGCRKERLRHNSTGSFCALVPTNTSYFLKQIALGAIADTITDMSKAGQK